MKEQQIPHVTLTGDRTGDYVVHEERPDGMIVLQPETRAEGSLRRLGLQPLDGAEFHELAADMQPSDGEG